MKRFTDTDIWDKQWFMELPPRLKCFVKFVRDKCDQSGVWQPNMILANTYIGEACTIDDLLKIDGGNQFEKLTDGKIFCIGFIFFQYGELSETCMPHRKVIALLKKHGIFERVSKGYRKGTDTLKDKEEDKEVDKEEEEEGGKIILVYPFNDQLFLDAWEVWKQYKKREHRFKYKTLESEQAALKDIGEISNYDLKTALTIIQKSIANGYKGLFELKNNKNGNSAQQPASTVQTGLDKIDAMYRVNK